MTTYASLRAAGLDVCERHGYRTEQPDRGWLPDAIATAPADEVTDDGDATTSSSESDVTTSPGDSSHERAAGSRFGDVTALFGDVGTPIAIEPLEAGDIDPTTVISRLWNNSRNDRRSLFVVPGGDADALAQTVVRLLAAPACVASEDDDGCRTFYNGPDRIALAGGGYALHKSTDPDFCWFEEVDEGGDGVTETDSTRTGSDGTRLVLADGDDEVAVFDDVDGLGCPPASSFPYSYRRNPRDKCFHVTDAAGREVGVFTDVRSMRAAAYEPVPMPFVPEHLFDSGVRTRWGVLAVDDDRPRLYTADGRDVL
jgi:hypothetical protein